MSNPRFANTKFSRNVLVHGSELPQTQRTIRVVPVRSTPPGKKVKSEPDPQTPPSRKMRPEPDSKEEEVEAAAEYFGVVDQARPEDVDDGDDEYDPTDEDCFRTLLYVAISYRWLGCGWVGRYPTFVSKTISQPGSSDWTLSPDVLIAVATTCFNSSFFPIPNGEELLITDTESVLL